MASTKYRVYVIRSKKGINRVKAIIHSESGPPITSWKTVRGTYADAERIAAEWRLKLGADFGGSPPTVAALIERYSRSLETLQLSPNSRITLFYTLQRNVAPVIGPLAPWHVRRSDCERCIVHAIDQGLSVNTQRRIRSAISGLFKYAVAQEFITKSPALALPIASATHEAPKIRALPDATLRRVINATDGKRRMILIILLATGIRRGELCGLQWQDFDTEFGMLRIERSVWQAGAEHGIKPPKTRSGVRTIDLPGSVIDQLTAWRERCEIFMDKAAGRALVPEDHIFRSASAEHAYMLPSSLSKMIRDSFRVADVPAGIAAHALRHSHGTALADDGAPIHQIARRLGHARTSVTADMYLHAGRASASGLAGRTEAMLRKIATPD